MGLTTICSKNTRSTKLKNQNKNSKKHSIHKENMFFSLHQAINHIKFQEEEKIATGKDRECMKSLIGKHCRQSQKGGKMPAETVEYSTYPTIISEREEPETLCSAHN